MEVEISHPNPNAQINPHHRKIELQSPLDLTYLQSNLHTLATQKLDLHFPPSAYRRPAEPATFISLGGPSSHTHPSTSQSPSTASAVASASANEEEDPLRARVRNLVDQFLTRTWQGAARNITINGLDAHTLPFFTQQETSSTATNTTTNNTAEGNVREAETEREGIDFTYTPYDSRLQQRVAQLYGEVERLTAEVSQLRREAPAKGAERFEEAMDEAVKEEDEVFEAARREMEEKVEWNEVEMKEEWWDEMKSGYESGVGELGKLTGVRGVGGGGSLTETVGKVQRARQVAMEFE